MSGQEDSSWIRDGKMREIKFRAWDKENKRFGYFHLNPQSISWPSNEYMFGDILYGMHGFAEGHKFFDIEGFQQYTGLKDKNGVEIFEGDILKHDLWGPTTVIWDNEGACFRGNSEERDMTLAHHQLERSRVIGNIYENQR